MDKNKSKVTEHSEICIFCGRPAECEHHLIFGIAHKEKADEDGLVVRLAIIAIISESCSKECMRIRWLKNCRRCWDRRYGNVIGF